MKPSPDLPSVKRKSDCPNGQKIIRNGRRIALHRIKGTFPPRISACRKIAAGFLCCFPCGFGALPVLFCARRSPAPAVYQKNKRITGFYVFILSYAHMLCQATAYFSSTLAKKRPPRREIAAGRNERTFCVRQIPGHVISRISYPLRCFAPPPLTSLFRCFSFAHKRKATRILRKDLTERQPRARGALLRYIAVFPPSLPRWGKVPFLSCSCSAFRKGKNPITSDGIFANLCQRFDLPYRKRTVSLWKRSGKKTMFCPSDQKAEEIPVLFRRFQQGESAEFFPVSFQFFHRLCGKVGNCLPLAVRQSTRALFRYVVAPLPLRFSPERKAEKDAQQYARKGKIQAEGLSACLKFQPHVIPPRFPRRPRPRSALREVCP